MARLIRLDEFQPSGSLNPNYYFPDAWWDSRAGSRGAWRFKVESGYPHALHMHKDRLDDGWTAGKHGALRVEIRRFVERHLEGDVILSYREINYWYRPEPSKHNRYPDREEVRHGYWRFSFETEADLLHFKLRFGEHLDEVSNRNPEYAWVPEEQIGRW